MSAEKEPIISKGNDNLNIEEAQIKGGQDIVDKIVAGELYVPSESNNRTDEASKKLEEDFKKIEEDESRDADRPARKAESIRLNAELYQKQMTDRKSENSQRQAELRDKLGLSSDATYEEVEKAYEKQSYGNLGKYALSMALHLRNPLRVFTPYNIDKAIDGEKFDRVAYDKAWEQAKQEK
jgi:hypothetical protein